MENPISAEPADRVADALAALLNWGRDNTSPRDENTPHPHLVEAKAALDEYAAKNPSYRVKH
jgi:hypothetical protein